MDQEPVQNNSYQPQNQDVVQPTMPTIPPKKSRAPAIAIAVLVLLALAGFAFGFWQYSKNNSQNKPAPLPVAVTPSIVPSVSNYPTSTQAAENPTTTPNNYPTSTLPADYVATPPVCQNPGPILASKSAVVQWVSPQTLNNFTLFASASPSPDSDYGSDSSVLVGHFIAGQYQGGDLLITTMTFNSPGGPSWFYIVRLGSQYTVLDKYSDTLPDPSDIKLTAVLAEDKNFDLPDLDFPQTLHSQNPAADFTLAGNLGFYKNGVKVFCADHYVKAFTDPGVGDVYTDAGTESIGTGPYAYFPMFGFYVKAPDGMQETYQLNVDFTGKDNVPEVSFNGGKKNIQEYSFQHIGGCGASQFLDIVDVKASDLVQIGTTFGGQTIYGYRDSQNADLTGMYGDIYTPDGQTNPSYAQFLADNPIFFWQDPFGQFVRFKITKYQPLAECGKPVIYLYPPETEKISVQINPLGGLFKTEPAYNNGWNVLADPQGSLTNLADGQKYPYLFWEGRGGMYQTPDKGFVVAQADVHQFLTQKLQQLGLNQKESADFMQFWEPKMQGAPYYFVTFMGNDIMDQLAPLSINPKPDTVIRVLMDFKPLSQPINVEGFNIRTPARKGFTVVEWGGVLNSGKN